MDNTLKLILLQHKQGRGFEDTKKSLLDLFGVRLSLPTSDEIADAAMEYAEIDGTTDKYDESVRDAAHFVAGATWYHKKIKGN